jgi:hypothetical protein
MTITANRAISAEAARTRRLGGRVLELLEEERLALERGDLDAVGDLTPVKERAVLELRAAFDQGPRSLGAGHDGEVARMVRQIAAANAVNGQYVAVRLAYARARLGGLGHAVQMARASADASAMYCADGFSGGLKRAGALFGRA